MQTWYLSDQLANVNGSTLPSGFLTTLDDANTADAGSSAKSLVDVAGAATSTWTITGGICANNGTREAGSIQICSGPLAAQSIGSGNWTIGFSTQGTNATNIGWRGRAALYLVNGSTGAIRTTIFAWQTIGNDKTNISQYRTVYSTTVSGSSATATAGDYLALECGAQVYSNGGGSFGVVQSVRAGNTTAISSDNATNTTPLSFLTAPASLTMLGTQVYLTTTASDINPGAELENTASFSRGGSSATYVTTTTVSGTSIQATNTAGGTILTWFTTPLAAVTIAGSISIVLRGLESAGTVNAGRRIKIERTDINGSVLSTVVALTNHGTEFTTTDNMNASWTITPTSTALSQGDRLKITLYVANVGTMAAGTVTYSVNGPTANAAGDTWLRFYESLSTSIPASLTGVAMTATASSSVSVWGTPNNILHAVVMDSTASTPAAVLKSSYNFPALHMDATASSAVATFTAAYTFIAQLLSATASSPIGTLGANYVLTATTMTALASSAAGVLKDQETFFASVATAIADSQPAVFHNSVNLLAQTMDALATLQALTYQASSVFIALPMTALAEMPMAIMEIVYPAITAFLTLAPTLKILHTIFTTLVTSNNGVDTPYPVIALPPTAETTITSRLTITPTIAGTITLERI